VGNGGDDTLAASPDGGVFDVQFDGGPGNDTLTGSYARDRYHFDRGDGSDLIRDDVRSLNADVAAFFSANPGTASYQDELQFGAGIATADVLRQRVGDDLVFSLSDGSGSVRVEGWYDGTLLRKIETITFASGSSWSAADAEQGLPGLVRSTSGTVWGTGAADQLSADGYGATLWGGGGDDKLVAAAAGNVFDVNFHGGKGNDSLTGSYARDFYFFDVGDGHDRIHDDVGAMGPNVKAYFAANPTADTYQDHLLFGAGIAPGDVVRHKVGQDLELSFNGGADSVTIEGWFDGTIFNKIELIGFANGTTWTAAMAEQGL
jgi:Ca2+-binding RTX toxin-like protein